MRIEEHKCKKCGRCVRVCPSAVLVLEKGACPTVARFASCIKCGHCVDVCEADAIQHPDFPPEKVHWVQKSLIPSPESLMELIKSRRSNRTITSAPVPEESLRSILEAAAYAPTAENTRKVQVTVLKGDDIQQVEDATMRFFIRLARVLMSPLMRPLTKLALPDLYNEAPELGRFEARWKAGEKPCACNGTVMLVFSAPKGYDFGWQDCNLAYQNASLMAEACGISQVYMGLIQTALKLQSHSKSVRLLHLPKGHRMYALMALGVPAFQYARYTDRY